MYENLQQHIEIENDGVAHSGRYAVSAPDLTVIYRNTRRTVPLKRSSLDILAKEVLREIVESERSPASRPWP